MSHKTVYIHNHMGSTSCKDIEIFKGERGTVSQKWSLKSRGLLVVNETQGYLTKTTKSLKYIHLSVLYISKHRL